ncbi:MAG: hypothetical protein ACRDIU_08870 [Actinomycetota bacterium]
MSEGYDLEVKQARAEEIMDEAIKKWLELGSYHEIRNRTPPVFLPAFRETRDRTVLYRLSVMRHPDRQTRIEVHFGDGQWKEKVIGPGRGMKHGVLFKHAFSPATEGDVVQTARTLDTGAQSEAVTRFR